MTEEVTQADRDAAANYMRRAGVATAESYRGYVGGVYDASNIVQAFARHRLAHLPTDLSEERAREVLYEAERSYAGSGRLYRTEEAQSAIVRAMHQYAAGLQGEVEALRTQRDEVIEECATVASEMGDAWHREWRAGLKASTHLEGKSDGADEIAAAIRNLKSQDEPR